MRQIHASDVESIPEYPTVGHASRLLYGSRRAVYLRRAIAAGELESYGTMQRRRVRWIDALAWSRAQAQRATPVDAAHAERVIAARLEHEARRAQG